MTDDRWPTTEDDNQWPTTDDRCPTNYDRRPTTQAGTSRTSEYMFQLHSQLTRIWSSCILNSLQDKTEEMTIRCPRRPCYTLSRACQKTLCLQSCFRVDRKFLSLIWFDQPGLSVGRPMGAQAYFVSGFYFMVGLRLCDTLNVSEDDVASRVQGVVPIPIVFGTNSCSYYCDHHIGIRSCHQEAC